MADRKLGWWCAAWILVALPFLTAADRPRLDSIRDAIARGQWTLAETELEILLSASPSDDVEAEALYLRALLANAGGDPAAALRDVQAAQRIGPPLHVAADALLLEGEVLYALQRFAESGERLERYLAESAPGPERERGEWLFAEASARLDRCPAAVDIYSRLARSATTAELRQRAGHGRAWCRRRMGDEDGAFRDFVAAGAGPDAEVAARSRFEAGASAYRLGRFEDAIEWVSRPEDAPFRDAARSAVILGQALYALDRKDEALPYLLSALDAADESERPTLLYQVGRIQLDTGLNAEAAESFSRLLAAPGVPDSLRASAEYGVGTALVRSGRLNEAVGPLERVRQSGHRAWGAQARYALAYIYNRLGDYTRSASLVQELRTQFPDSPLLGEATLVQGENYFQAGRYEEAVRAYRQRLERGEGDRGDALFRIGVALFKLGRYAEAERELRDLILRYPQSPHRGEGRFWLAETVYRQGRIKEAREAYEAVRAADPEGPHAADALYGLAWCDYADGDYAQAASRFGLLLDLYRATGKEDEILYRRGNCFYNMRRFDLAVEEYDHLIRSYPQSALAAKAFYQKAWSLHRLDRFDEAAAAFEELERRFPDSPDLAAAVYWGAVSHFKTGRFDRSASAFARVAAIATAPDSLRIQARLRQAESYVGAGDLTHASAVYGELTEKTYPREIRETAYSAWMRSLESAGRESEAAGVAEKMGRALPESQTSGEALYRIGVRYLESGRTKEGIKSLREYLKVGTPEEYRVDANRRCAEASVSLGEKVRAAEYYRDAAHWGDRQDGIDYRFEAGRLFFEAGKFGPAREEFDRVLKLKPDGETRHLTLYNLGLALKELKQVDAALEAFREVAVEEAAKASTRADAMLEAGLILRDQGKQDEAKEMLCRGAAALGTGSTGAEGQYWCSEFDFEAGRFDDAVAGYFRILQSFAGEKEWGLSARYRLAESFEKLNRWTNAREQYEEIVKRSDDDAWRADAQKRLDWIKENSWVFDEKPRGDPSRWKSQG